MYSRGSALFWKLALLALACSPLPDAAAPSGGLVDPSTLDLSNAISYRPLTRADFKGKAVPAAFAAVGDRLGAATCGHVVTTPDTQLLMVGEHSPSGDRSFRVNVKRLRFRAFMDPNCSWWNDKVAAFAPDYVLEHEQIHFALYELGARQLNASAGQIARDMQTEGTVKDEVLKEAELTLRQALLDALEVILERSRAFDEDTSLGYEPERQKVWLERVNKELASTRELARSSSDCASSRLVALGTFCGRGMEEQERGAKQVFERNSDDVPSAREPCMSVSDTRFGLQAARFGVSPGQGLSSSLKASGQAVPSAQPATTSDG